MSLPPPRRNAGAPPTSFGSSSTKKPAAVTPPPSRSDGNAFPAGKTFETFDRELPRSPAPRSSDVLCQPHALLRDALLVDVHDLLMEHHFVLVLPQLGSPQRLVPIRIGDRFAFDADLVCTWSSRTPPRSRLARRVSYTPSGADTTAVTIGANAVVTVTITNDFRTSCPRSAPCASRRC